MGKKQGEESSKRSKDENKQFDSWIKVLKPKVYITDSSSFKRLVQELTGNGKTISSPPSFETVKAASFNVEDLGEPESSTESSLYSFEFRNQLLPLPEELNDQYHFDDTTSDDLLWMNQHQEELESLLADIDGYSPIYQEGEVSIYDYEISGLL